LEESFGIAVDGSGNIWIGNEQSPASINNGRCSITELSAGRSYPRRATMPAAAWIFRHDRIGYNWPCLNG